MYTPEYDAVTTLVTRNALDKEAYQLPRPSFTILRLYA